MPAKIMTEKDLSLFLRVLAEESVKKAYDSELSSAFPLFEQGGEEEEDPLFGGDGDDESGDEGGDDPLAGLGADDEGGEDAPEGGKDAPEAPAEPEPKQDKVETRPTPLTLELGEVTSDGLMATLNMIRAGRSFKEPDVSAELEKYFEQQLNDSERLALATFLSAIRDLTSGTPAEDAPEPDDENVNIDATDGEREEHQAREKIPQGGPPAPRAAPSMPRGVEDISPPIQVGQRNPRLAEEYREHIRSLLVG